MATDGGGTGGSVGASGVLVGAHEPVGTQAQTRVRVRAHEVAVKTQAKEIVGPHAPAEVVVVACSGGGRHSLILTARGGVFR